MLKYAILVCTLVLCACNGGGAPSSVGDAGAPEATPQPAPAYTHKLGTDYPPFPTPGDAGYVLTSGGKGANLFWAPPSITSLDAGSLSPGSAGQVLWTNSATSSLWGAAPYRSAVIADGADATGSVDSSTAIHNCLVNAVATSTCCALPPGTFKVASPITVPSFACLRGTASTTIRSTITPGVSNTNSVFVAVPTFGSSTTLASNNTPGASTISLTTNIGGAVTAGATIEIAGGPSSPQGLRAQQYTVQSISGVGPYTVTVDRPVLDQYLTSNGALVAILTYRPQLITIDGGGMLMTGTGWRYSELLTCFHCRVAHILANESGGTLQADYAMSFDLAGLENEFEDIRMIVSTPQAGVVFESNERGVAKDSYVQGPTTYGFLDQDSFGTRFRGDSAGSVPDGIGVGSDGTNLGCTGDQIVGGQFTNCTYGVVVTQGSTGTSVAGITSRLNTSAGVYLSANGAASSRTSITDSVLTNNVVGLLIDNTVTGTMGTGLDLSNNTGATTGTALQAGTGTDVKLSAVVAKGLGSYGFIAGGTLDMSGFEVQSSVASNILVSNINTTGPAAVTYRLANGHIQLDGNSSAGLDMVQPGSGAAKAYLSQVKVDGAGTGTTGVAANTSTIVIFGSGVDVSGTATPNAVGGSGVIEYQNTIGSSVVFQQAAASTDFASFGTTPGTHGSVRCTAGTDCIDSPGALDIGGTGATSVAVGNSLNTTTVNLITASTNDPVNVEIGGAFVANFAASAGDYLKLGASQTTQLTPGSLTTTSGNMAVDSAAALTCGASTATSFAAGNTTNTATASTSVKSSGTITGVVGSTTAQSITGTETTVNTTACTGASCGLQVQRNSSFYGSIQGLVGAESTDSAVYLGPGLTPNGTNEAITTDGSTFTEFNALGTAYYMGIGGTAYLTMSTSGLYPNTAGAMSAGLSTNPFGAAYFGAGNAGYTAFPAISGTHNSQDGILSYQVVDGRISNHSANSFNTYQLSAHHGMTVECSANVRVVNAGVGCSSFWNTASGAADATFACFARGTGYCTTSSSCTGYASPYYFACDVTGSTTPANGGSPTNPIVAFSAITNASDLATIQWTAFNGTCGTSDPVLDVVSQCKWQDN